MLHKLAELRMKQDIGNCRDTIAWSSSISLVGTTYTHEGHPYEAQLLFDNSFLPSGRSIEFIKFGLIIGVIRLIGRANIFLLKVGVIRRSSQLQYLNFQYQ